MLWTVMLVLIVLWALGLVSGLVGNLIHALLVIALVVFAYQMLSGRRAV